ncbi:hypothetical protein Py04_1645 [Pyrococcus sp. ST04]|nr:hypothetical protein Py04_1645 [Pyrococcus sp. ST04]
MGTGTGILALIAARKARFCIGVDINRKALELAWKNAKLNNVRNVMFVFSDLFSNIKGSFDLIVFNPPYLPGDEEEIKEDIDRALIGGKGGGEIIQKFLQEVKGYLEPGGRVLLVYSSLTKPDPEKLFRTKGFKTEIIDSEKLFFEELYVMRAELSSHW